MKIKVKETYDTYDMTGVVAVITEEQYYRLLETCRDKSVLLDILKNDKLFNQLTGRE